MHCRDLEAVFSSISHQTDQRYDSASTAPRSTDGSFSEDVFTESELSPIREEHQSTEELQQDDKSSGASSQSVQTLLQEPQSHTEEEDNDGEPAGDTAKPIQDEPTSSDHQQTPHCQTEGEPTAQESSAEGDKLTRDGTRDSETDVEELRKMCKTHTMQQAKEQRESVQQAQRESEQQTTGQSQRLSSAEGNTASSFTNQTTFKRAYLGMLYFIFH